MNRLLPLLTVIVFLFSSQTTAQTTTVQTDLAQGFKNPPAAARPRTWWHWVDGNITRSGITADLEAMQRIGIKEAQLFNVGIGYPYGQVKYLSKEWLDLFQYAVSEAGRLGIDIGFNHSAGWSSTGGPSVTPADAMKKLVSSELRIPDGETYDHVLPKPQINLNYYKDIAVLAFPTPKTARRIPDLHLKAQSGQFFRRGFEPDDADIPEDAAIQQTSIIDLSSKLDANGQLDWTPPPGDWTILRFGYTAMGTQNHPAVQGGTGLECDKMDTAALDRYWVSNVIPILHKLSPETRKVVKNCVLDSYEVGCDNWTAAFRQEFLHRRSYDCLKYLPTLAGYYVGSNEISERFLWDFRKTQSDLIADYYYGHFSKLCHENGLKFAVEPYGGPFDSQRAGVNGDIVMGEFWLSNQLFLESPKLASSIAHLKGDNITGAEAFTSYGGWKDAPAAMRPLGDRVWAEGINRLIFHTYVHQPWNTPPGLSFGPFGIEMDRMNTWWNYSKPYMDYIARSQFLLQQGHSHADVLVFTGESVPNFGILRNDIKSHGYDYDQIGPDQLQTLSVKDGKLYTRHSGPYSLLVIPESAWATPQLLEKCAQLVDAGALIAAKKPRKSPSLTGFPQCDDQVSKLANQLWPGKIHDIQSADEIQQLLMSNKLTPDFNVDGPHNGISFIHRVDRSEDIYFIANALDQSRVMNGRFRVSGKQPQYWDPETGKVTRAAAWQTSGAITEMPVSLPAHGSIFIIFTKTGAQHSPDLTAKANIHITGLKGFKLITAAYGALLPAGLIDVTTAITYQARNHAKTFQANNLSNVDPTPGVMKELRIEYEAGGKRRIASLLEDESKTLTGDTTGFRIIRALYGKFPDDLRQFPKANAIYDVSQQVQANINAGKFRFVVADSTFNVTADSNSTLQLKYQTNGKEEQQSISSGDLVLIGNEEEYAKPIDSFDISTDWKITFPKSKTDKIQTTSKQLSSWAVSENKGIRYFSGTATYQKEFMVHGNFVAAGRSTTIDLGDVKEIAEVYINGKRIGILWKSPFKADITKALHAGRNSIRIKVTNLWPNRLIGDAQLPDDGIQRIGSDPAWPRWLLDGATERTSGRTSFDPYRHFNADAQLLPSGLLGPVFITSQ